MLDANRIIEIVDQYIVGAPTKRVLERVQTLGSDVELETKINIESIQDIVSIMKEISKLGISKVEKRFEYHHFFAGDNDQHDVLILVHGSREVWIKKKKDRQVITAPDLNLPILLRHESKMKPNDKNYLKSFSDIFSKPYIGNFEKTCIDLSFYFNDLSFTATMSLAFNPLHNSQLYQIEFEYDGHKENTTPPSFELIVSEFERMLKSNFLNFLKRITPHTKLEWLKTLIQ